MMGDIRHSGVSCHQYDAKYGIDYKKPVYEKHNYVPCNHGGSLV